MKNNTKSLDVRAVDPTLAPLPSVAPAGVTVYGLSLTSHKFYNTIKDA